jgi:hypothetical protein
MTTELVTPRGHGIVRVSHNLREHVTNPRYWAESAGTDFWIGGGPGEATVATGQGLDVLAVHGWVTTSIVEDVGSDGSFLDASDQDPSSFHFNAASDLLTSPGIFGSYAHGQLAGQFLGFSPTTLTLEIFAAFLDATGAETASGFGFVEGGGSIVTADDALAVIHSDGTNFKLRSGAATSGAGPVDDTDWHHWKIKITSAGVQWFVDGVRQNDATSLLALEADEFPVNFGIGVVGGGTNYMKMAWAHIYYS